MGLDGDVQFRVGMELGTTVSAVGSTARCEVIGDMYGFRLCVNACKVCVGVGG